MLTTIQSQKNLLQKGFTLMELLIVLVILGLLMGIGVPVFMGILETNKRNTTDANLKIISQTIDYYHLQSGTYPKRLEDLIEKPKGPEGEKWAGPYLKGKKLPVDGWKHEFHYKLTPNGKKPYELYSYGSKGPEAALPEEYISVWDL